MQHFPTVQDPSVKNEIMQALTILPPTLDEQALCTMLTAGKHANFGQCLELS